MPTNKVVGYMKNKYDALVLLASGKKDYFSENTAFNRNFGANSGDVARGNHDHAGLYEPKNANIQSHITNQSNPHNVTADDLNLENVDNTSDVDKIVSDDTEARIAGVENNLLEKINAINTLLASDDTTLDELQEVVDFIKQNKEELESLGISNIAGLQTALDGKIDKVSIVNNLTSTSATTVLSGKQGKVLNDNHLLHKNATNNPHQVTKAQVGLSEVDNTADLDKPTSTATQEKLDLKVDKLGAHISSYFYSPDNSVVFWEDGIDRIKPSASWDACMLTKEKYTKNVRISFTPDIIGDDTNAKIMFGFGSTDATTDYNSAEYCFYLYENKIYRWLPDPHTTIGTGYNFHNEDTIEVEKIGNMITIYISGKRIHSELTGDMFADGCHFKFFQYRNEAKIRNLDISFPITSINRIDYDVFSATKSVDSGDAVDICTFKEMEIAPGKGLDVSLSVPCRNSDSYSWGGMYINLMMSIDGGDWKNLGNGGYDGNVMHYSAKSIATATASYVLDIPNNMDISSRVGYKVQFKLRGRSYNYKTIINGSHDINRTANELGIGTALEWAKAQNYTKIIVKEYDV